MKVKIYNASRNKLPIYETKNAAGFDIRAETEYRIKLKPNQRILVHTGLYMEIPNGYELQIRPRSGLALKHGITIVNSPGTIDSDYRGEIGIILLNTSTNDFFINNGDRIAQGVLNKINYCEWEEVESIEELSSTIRGKGGFGHTNIKK